MAKRRWWEKEVFETRTRQFKGGTLFVTQVPEGEEQEGEPSWIAVYAKHLERDQVTGDVHIEFGKLIGRVLRRAFGIQRDSRSEEDLPAP